MSWKCLLFLMLIEFSVSLAPNDVVIFIASQPDEYHNQLGLNLQSNIYNQSVIISKSHLVNVHLLHDTFNHPGDWTFLAILPQLATTNLIKPNTKWIILCEDQSNLNLRTLLNQLNSEDHTQEKYLGHTLYDREATIIHHFAFFEYPQWFPYPLIRSGVAFTVPLINKLTKRVRDEKPTTDFFIDASHELSLFIWQNMRIENTKYHQQNISEVKKIERHSSGSSGSGSITQIIMVSDNNSSRTLNISISDIERDDTIIPLVSNINYQHSDSDNVPPPTASAVNLTGHHHQKEHIRKKALSNPPSPWGVQKNTKLHLVNNNANEKVLLTTATYLCSEKGYACAIYPNIQPACSPISPETIYFAIKTCQKFHKERVPTIETTWGRYAIYKRYFSDVRDENIPTISTGIPNTETGHCSKTLSILRIVLQDINEMHRIHKIKKINWVFLSDDDTLLSVSAVCDILGCFNPDKDIYLGERYGYRIHSKDGFNYITGGGGIVFSLSTVKKILDFCTCPTISSPDDMIIGSCLQGLGIKAIHSSRFHQARPPDYARKLLSMEKPVSFHKFWQIDPNYLYTKWFEKADQKLLTKPYLINDMNNNCDYINTSHNTNTGQKIRKILKNIGQQQQNTNTNSINHSSRKLQEHSEYYTTFKSKLQHIDL